MRDAPPLSDIAQMQAQYPELGPEEKKLAEKIIMERSRFNVIVDDAGKWRITVHVLWREALIKEAHDGRFGGHFAEKRLYQLNGIRCGPMFTSTVDRV